MRIVRAKDPLMTLSQSEGSLNQVYYSNMATSMSSTQNVRSGQNFVPCTSFHGRKVNLKPSQKTHGIYLHDVPSNG
ncbi:hypothetical protein HOLleu_14527 [Holothuria leucospilota]|uniref:Uncharacterized protein n=1 Tax=Holothuria leucospilota TaxID=206669 RepID=A0A9Q1H905_HOLLE|nr:hypothetical protein HOLleu_14527 [Holothuria leucospilota]